MTATTTRQRSAGQNTPPTLRNMRRPIGKAWSLVVRYCVPVAFGLAILVPLLGLLLGSFLTRAEYAADPFRLPGSLQLDNYVTAWQGAGLGEAYINNTIVSLAAVGGIVCLGSFAAYGIVRSARGINRFAYAFFAIGLMVPFQLGLPSLYKMWVQIDLVDSLLGVILIQIGANLPMAVFLYCGLLLAIPSELEESARVDGASNFRTFRSIVFPLLSPAHATVIVLTSISVWNDLLVAVFFLQSEGKMTLSRRLLGFVGQFNSDVPVIYAASIMVVLPIIVVFFLLQRHLVAGITQGALKG